MQPDEKGTTKPFSIFDILEKIEWDTLLFFYGIMLSVGGLGAFGYLHSLSTVLYEGLGATIANILIGILSAIVDNIPLTFAVTTMNPRMDLRQWLLLTLTAGVGGSLLSVGSAAGVALMGSARGSYTFYAPQVDVGHPAGFCCGNRGTSPSEPSPVHVNDPFHGSWMHRTFS